MTSVPERDADPPSRSGAFEVVRRGYARDQVDALVRELERRARAAENARRMAEQHAAGLAEELRALRAGTPAEGLPTVPQSFGFRAEKVLRLAEREASDIRAAAERDAAEIRAAATREATDLMERAHAAAGQARADAEAEWAAVVTERADLAAQVAEHVERMEELAGLRAALRNELARVHAALGAELRGLDAALSPAGPFPVAEEPEQPTGPEQQAGPEQSAVPDQEAGQRETGEAPTTSPVPVVTAHEAEVPTATAGGAEEPARVDGPGLDDEADEAAEAAGATPPAEPADPVAEQPVTEPAEPTAEAEPAPGEPSDEPTPAVWTPTPGTADLFEAEAARPADRGSVRVPEQRREQTTESRHALRSG